MPTLPVELNADGVYSIQAPTEFTTTEPFTIELRNRGQPVHVHLNVDDELARVAKLGATSHYVDADSVTRVRVQTREPEDPTGGKLKIAAGHGSETHYVDVDVEPIPEEEEPVVLDEDLATPAEPDPEPSTPDLAEQVAESLPDRSALPDIQLSPVHAFVLLTVAAAILVGVLVRSAIVTAGVLVVIVAAVGALAVLQSESRSESP